MKPILLAALAAVTLGTAAHAAPPKAPAEPQASIPFVNHNGIRDWQATDSSTLFVQDSQRRWYRASLFSPCFDLPFAMAIGFETRGIDSFDRFSSIRVGRDSCQVSSLTPSDGPPAKVKRGRS